MIKHILPKPSQFFLREEKKLDYREIVARYPWIVQDGQDCILSPDTDGFLCGLLMAHYLGWKIKGFYDGKVMLLDKNISAKDCVFLDMEIFRKEIKSVGHHIVMFNKDRLPANWKNFDNCFSANNVRGYDAKHNFSQKYPLGTIHLLLGVLGSIKRIATPPTAICPLLYTDGTFKNLFNYPENCLNWLKFLQADNVNSPLYATFFNDNYSIYSLMTALDELFGELRLIAGGKRGGDKIKLSNGKGELVNFNEKKKSLERSTLEQAEKFLHLLSHKTGWRYTPDNWSWNNLSHFTFKKGTVKPSQRRYDQLMVSRPVSLAMTSAIGIEYTLDPKKFLK